MRRTRLLLWTIASGTAAICNSASTTADDNPFARPMLPRVSSEVAARTSANAGDQATVTTESSPPTAITPGASVHSATTAAANPPIANLRNRRPVPSSLTQSAVRVQPAAPVSVAAPASEALAAVQDPAPGLPGDSETDIPQYSGNTVKASIYGTDRIASAQDNQLVIPTLIVPTTRVDLISKNIPVNVGGNALSAQKALPEGFDRVEDWSLTAYLWQAPNTYSHPLYFEDVMLERHGHERFPCLQPFVSGGRFFATIPMLPYLAAVRDPWDCDYHLGYYRPGSCAPALLQRPPYERRAAIIQAGATAGAIIAFP